MRTLTTLLLAFAVCLSAVAEVTRTGTHEYHKLGGANSGSVSITVPIDAELAVLCLAGYENNPFYFTENADAMTINGVNMTSVPEGNEITTAFMGAIFYLQSPATGAQTLAWNWKGTDTANNHVHLYLLYYKDVDTVGSAVGDTGGQQKPTDPFETGLLTANRGDALVACSWQYAPSEIDVSWANATKYIETDFRYSWSELSIAEDFNVNGNVEAIATWTGSGDGGALGIIINPVFTGPSTVILRRRGR